MEPGGGMAVKKKSGARRPGKTKKPAPRPATRAAGTREPSKRTAAPGSGRGALYGVWASAVASDESRRFTFGPLHGRRCACNRLYETVHDRGECRVDAAHGKFVFTIRG